MTYRPLFDLDIRDRGVSHPNPTELLHACYCSVLNECWQTDFDQQRPTPVDKYTSSKGDKLW